MRRIALLAVPLLAILVAACGGGSAAATTAAGGTIKLTLSEFKYSSSTLEMKADEKATLELKNAGTVEHDFKLDAAGVDVLVQPGKTATRTIGPLKAGTYEFFCSVPGHKEAGMKGQLIVK